MQPGGVLIDLGTDRTAPEIDIVPPAVSRQARLGWRLALVMVLLMTLGAAVPEGVRPLGTRLLIDTGAGDRAVLVGDRLYVLGPVGAVRAISSYLLPSGAPAWTADFPAAGQVRQIRAAGGVLLVATADVDNRDPVLYAYDLRTGAALWRTEAWIVDTVAGTRGGVLLLAPRTARTRPPPNGPMQVTAVDPRTRAVRWIDQLDFPAFYGVGGEPGEHGVPGDGDDTAPAGRWSIQVPIGSRDAEVRDLWTGALAARGPVAPPHTTVLDVILINGLVLVHHLPDEPGPAQLTAFAPVPLKPLWTVAVPIRDFAVADCGPVICFHGDAGVAALDPRTGAVAWRSESYREPVRLGDMLVVREAGTETAALVSTAGATVLSLGDWRLLGRDLLVRAGPGQIGAWFGVIDVPDRTVRTLGSAPAALPATCRLGPGVVVCDLIGGGVGVWPYRV